MNICHICHITSVYVIKILHTKMFVFPAYIQCIDSKLQKKIALNGNDWPPLVWDYKLTTCCYLYLSQNNLYSARNVDSHRIFILAKHAVENIPEITRQWLMISKQSWRH